MENKTEYEELEQVNRELARLFARRMELVRRVASYRRERALPVRAEGLIVPDGAEEIADDALRAQYVRFYRDVKSADERFEQSLMRSMRVAFSGAEGAFAHIAVRRIFPEAEAVAYPSFDAAYAATESGQCDAAVLPIENSYAGEVGRVMDLAFSGSLAVNGVYGMAVAQHLLAVPGAREEQIKTVVSHPQALEQCRGYLRQRGFAERSSVNTALAAQEVARTNDPTLAAVASEETAALYGLEIIRRDIHDRSDNTTRFAVFTPTRAASPDSRGGAFILFFTVKDEVGGLAGAINVISAYDFNLRVLRSRPLRELPWNYYFYAEVEGDDESDSGRRMLGALRGVCPTVKVVGHYDAGDNAQQGGRSI